MPKLDMEWAQQQFEPHHRALIELLGEEYRHTPEYNSAVLKVASGSHIRFVMFDLHKINEPAE